MFGGETEFKRGRKFKQMMDGRCEIFHRYDFEDTDVDKIIASIV